ncbi:2200_t:CDS:2 [Diversispora eburnea]|uniref:2200_t:CDS:1 n=1 Tax=Diversispora eburnea TaxID=1213867 RepID=A0A9N8V4T8_9GLOM|nr:2200_t:CDS:2 [Diversispora eburnea]
MRLKELESSLQNLSGFDEPKITLEQYCTTPHLAARMLYTAHSVYDDIESKVVADFGCGCGILSIASNLLESEFNMALDIDLSALQTAQKNCSNYEVEVDFILTDIKSNSLFKWKNKVDTIIATTSVYSLHKSSTREAKEWNVDYEIIAEMKFDVPMMYKFHKKKSVDIEVDFFRFSKKESRN